MKTIAIIAASLCIAGAAFAQTTTPAPAPRLPRLPPDPPRPPAPPAIPRSVQRTCMARR